jgi:hypothetical protein
MMAIPHAANAQEIAGADSGMWRIMLNNSQVLSGYSGENFAKS